MEKNERKKQHYDWWGYVKSIIRAYPGQDVQNLHGVATRNYCAVRSAIKETERMDDGQDRLKVIRMVHWDGTHTVEGAALAVPCSKRTANRWQRGFFEEVARNRGLLD